MAFLLMLISLFVQPTHQLPECIQTPLLEVPYLGVILDGAVLYQVSYVFPDSPADKAGIKVGDSIRAFNGNEYVSRIRDRLASYRAGNVVGITVMRGDEMLTLPVTLGQHEPVTLPPDDFSRVISAQPIDEMVELPKWDSLVSDLSPDGSTIVYRYGDGWVPCFYTITTKTADCPATYPEGLWGYNVTWSGNHGVFWSSSRSSSDINLWLYDRQQNTAVNLTEDHFEGKYDQTDVVFPADYLPVWAPDNSLYFFRAIPAEGTLGLFRIEDPFNASPPQLVHDLSDITSVVSGIYDLGDSLDGTAAISPDGSQIAFIVNTYPNILNNTENGVWIADLSGEQPPQQLVSLRDLAPFMTPDGEAMYPDSLVWIGDDLLIQLQGFIYSGVNGNPGERSGVIIRVADGKITALTNPTLPLNNTALSSDQTHLLYVLGTSFTTEEDCIISMDLRTGESHTVWKGDVIRGSPMYLGGSSRFSPDGRFALISGLLLEFSS